MSFTASIRMNAQPLDFRLFANSSDTLQQVIVVLTDWYKPWGSRIGIVEYYGREEVAIMHYAFT